MSSLKKLAVRGAVWAFVGHGARQVIRLGGNLLLTRLLVPEIFGLMALVNTFITGLNLFSDVGIGPSIIQNQRGDDSDFLNTAWTIQVIRGFGLWLCCFLVAWPIASFYEEPRLLWLIPLVGFSTVLSGFNSTAIFTLNRKMALDRLTKFELIVQVIGLVVMLAWAYFSPNILALVAGILVSEIFKAVWSHQLLPGVSRFAWNKDVVEEIVTFGRWVFISTAMAFCAGQADKLILGKLFSLEMLGIYTIAFTFSEIPREMLRKVSRTVIFPIVARQTELPRAKLRDKILRKRKLLLLGLAFLVATLTSFGDLLVLALYNQNYSQAAWMLPLLAIGVWPIVLADPMARCLYGVGKPQYLALGHFLRFLFIVALLPIAFYQTGVLGAIVVISLNDIPMYVAIAYGLWREKLLVFVQDVQATLILLAMIATLLFLRMLLGLEPPLAQILAL